jgi:hypothetical protein
MPVRPVPRSSEGQANGLGRPALILTNVVNSNFSSGLTLALTSAVALYARARIAQMSPC